jgi:hypothetical protein
MKIRERTTSEANPVENQRRKSNGLPTTASVRRTSLSQAERSGLAARTRHGNNRYYKGPFVRYEDLPDDLAKAFRRWQILAQIPFLDGSYLHDFEDFMARCGRGFNGDFSAIVEQYR